MTKHWLIALDLDGTLLHDGRSVSGRTRAAVRAAQMEGHTVVIATGRPLRTAIPVYQQVGLDTPLVTLNGAYVYLPPAHKAVAHTPVSEAVARTVFRTVREFEVQTVLVESGDQFQLYGDPDAPLWLPSHMLSEERLDVTALIRPLTNEPSCPVSAMVIHIPRRRHEAFASELRRQVSDAVSVRSWSSFDDVLEVTPSHVSKASGLALVERELQGERRRVIAFGDEMNDYAMLAFADVGVAMGNANPQLLAVANAVTGDCSQDGVAEYLERHILGRASFEGLAAIYTK